MYLYIYVCVCVCVFAYNIDIKHYVMKKKHVRTIFDFEKIACFMNSRIEKIDLIVKKKSKVNKKSWILKYAKKSDCGQ